MSSGVLNLELFNLSDHGSAGGSTSGAHLILLPETMILAFAVTKSPPCSKPFKGVSSIGRTTEGKSTDILAGVSPQLAGVWC